MLPPDRFAPGTVVAGKYRLDRVLGEGAMGKVVAARHVELDRDVALKFMIAQRGVEEEMATRFTREARAAARLAGEHVVRIFDVGRVDDGTPYLVMELLKGEDLATYLGRRQTLDPFEASDIVLQACEGVAEAHRAGIVHRDVKPQNLFLCDAVPTAQGRPRRFVKVLDFGLSKITPAAGAAKAEASLTKVPLGSPLYMAPEQLRSSSEVDARADVWALGTTLYELLTGEPPFVAPSLGEIYLMISQDIPVPVRTRRPAVPFGLDAIVMRCLEKAPSARYPDAQALGSALTRFLSSGSNTAQTPVEAWRAPIGAESRARASNEIAQGALEPISELPTEVQAIPDELRATLKESATATRRDPQSLSPGSARPLQDAVPGRGSLTSSTSQITPARSSQRAWILPAAAAFVAALAMAIAAAFVIVNRTATDHASLSTNGAHREVAGSDTGSATHAAPTEPYVVPGAPAPSTPGGDPSSSAAPSAKSAPLAPVTAKPAAASPAQPPPDRAGPVAPLPVPLPPPLPPQPAFDPSKVGRNL